LTNVKFPGFSGFSAGWMATLKMGRWRVRNCAPQHYIFCYR